MKIDARGLGCPKPVSLAQDALAKMTEGIVEVLVDNEASVKNITRFARKEGMDVETIKEDKYWCVKIIKGYVCESKESDSLRVSSDEFKETDKDVLLVIGTDALGKEEELGKILMSAFLDTIRAAKEIPHTIFFLNAGVRLTTIDEESIKLLKEIESMGAEIYSCGTCLKYYNLESELKVGHRGSTGIIVEGIKDFTKVVWI
ncbi:MAG: sulfurtransferase-like selenium metabolism protein YedF [Nitrospirae bacterium]|nr:sulfurtransferase-like selenium metabolism protein YedF [Nitrospirota bacterium]